MASIIYIDAPVGAGFSYVRNSGKLTVSDSKAGYEIHMFARKVPNVYICILNLYALSIHTYIKISISSKI